MKNYVTKDVFENLDTNHYELGPIIKSLKSSNYSPCGIPSRFIIDAHSSRRICCPIYLGQRTISVDSTFISYLRAAVLGSDKCGMSFLKALTLSPWMSLQNPPHHGVE